jgi:hypothetical protein
MKREAVPRVIVSFVALSAMILGWSKVPGTGHASGIVAQAPIPTPTPTVAGPPPRTPTATVAGPPTPTPTPTPTQVGPAPTPPPRPIRFYDVDPVFRLFYNANDGPRLLGSAISPRFPLPVSGIPAQYFEKGRMEDHRSASRNPADQFLYGLLVDELIAIRSSAPVGGDTSTVTYSTLAAAATEEQRIPAPPGFAGGWLVRPDGSVFIPFSAALTPAAGHAVPAVFWEYVNRSDLFPGGWLHDIGLPIVEPMEATVTKGPLTGRRILIQAFQRTVLTHDPLNPPDWRVERANTGTDYARVFPERVLQ